LIINYAFELNYLRLVIGNSINKEKAELQGKNVQVFPLFSVFCAFQDLSLSLGSVEQGNHLNYQKSVVDIYFDTIDPFDCKRIEK